jgi:hypothetical protein
MRHLETVYKEKWFYERSWLLLATGPSLDNFDYEKYKDHNIIAVYNAGDEAVTGHVDIHLCSDEWTKAWQNEDGSYQVEFYRPEHDGSIICKRRNARYVATRICNRNFAGAIDNMIFFPYTVDVNHMGHQAYLEAFKHSGSERIYPTSNTSSFAVMFLGFAGIKELKICGIDGGVGTSSKVDPFYRKVSDQNFDIENYGVYGHAENFGINLVRIVD